MSAELVYKQVSREFSLRTVRLPSVTMKAVILLACFSVCCSALRPRPCGEYSRRDFLLESPKSDGKLTAFAKYSYDALGQRVRLREGGSYDNETFHFDRVVYMINDRNHTCSKKRLDTHFHPLMVPRNSSLLGQVVLGSSSGPGQGLLVNTWVGELHMRNAKYMSTVTEFGCIPVTTLFHTEERGWVVSSFFNNVVGITDPDLLIPPSFCKNAELENEEETVTFFSLF
uniref:Ependymin-like 1 n=1 Tax=Nothobranchius furzeri TaxID=105023 RepID=A0A8C6Q864_NOTFU